MPDPSSLSTLTTLRRLLFAILLFGLVGTATELVLIGHDEDGWQMIPLFVIALAVLASAAIAVTGARAPALWLFRGVMVLLIVSGGLGAVLHYRANMEFKLDVDPSLSGWALFSSVVGATAPPALAPGNMVLLGLLGLACAYHLDGSSRSRNS
jgi:hypothetical protein